MNKLRKICLGLLLLLAFIGLSSCAERSVLKPVKTENPSEEMETIGQDSNFIAINRYGNGEKIDVFMAEFREICRNPEDNLNTVGSVMEIETRNLTDISTEGGNITRYLDGEGRLLRYRIVSYGEMGQSESNYYFLEDFVYYTNLEKEYHVPLTYLSENDLSSQTLDEGIITDGVCFRYDRQKDELQEEELSLEYSPEKLDELYEGGEEVLHEPTVKYEETEKALELYQEYLSTEDMYRITASPNCPGGDSAAVYAFGDCNGDGIPELHIEGGGTYRIYTCRGGELYLLSIFGNGRGFSSITPLKDGAFIGTERLESDRKTAMSSTRRIPPLDGVFSDAGKSNERTDYYTYFKLDYDGCFLNSSRHDFYVKVQGQSGTDESGDNIEEDKGQTNVKCHRDGCQETADTYIQMLRDASQSLTWNFIFPVEEWADLSGAEEDGTLRYKDDSKEWEAYERILSGNFSAIENLESRSHLISRYEAGLDKSTGRSLWKYILTDFNGDGIRELFIRYSPDTSDYSTIDYKYASNGVACFTYQDGIINWWDFDCSGERFVPLRDGRMLFYEACKASMVIMLGSFDRELNFQPVKIFESLTVEYGDYLDLEWYEENIFDQPHWELYVFCERVYEYPGNVREEGKYYFVQECEGSQTGELIEISENEWIKWSEEMGRLLIPDCEWEPASVFRPNPDREVFYIG